MIYDEKSYVWHTGHTIHLQSQIVLESLWNTQIVFVWAQNCDKCRHSYETLMSRLLSPMRTLHNFSLDQPRHFQSRHPKMLSNKVADTYDKCASYLAVEVSTFSLQTVSVLFPSWKKATHVDIGGRKCSGHAIRGSIYFHRANVDRFRKENVYWQHLLNSESSRCWSRWPLVLRMLPGIGIQARRWKEHLTKK